MSSTLRLLLSSPVLYDSSGTVASIDVWGRTLKDNGDNIIADWSTLGTLSFDGVNVGIGTITPTEKLHVSGNIKLSSIGSVFFDYSNSTPASGPSIQWTAGVFNADIGLYIQTGLVFQGDAGNPNFYVREATTDGTLGAISVQLGGTSNPSYFMTTVGIGTNFIPSGTALHVFSGDLYLDNNRLRFNYNNSTPGSGPSIKWTTGSDANALGLYILTGLVFQGDSANPRFTINAPTDTSSLGTAQIMFDPTGANPSFINVGNLGIGTSGSSHKLEIVDSPSSQADFIALASSGILATEGIGIGIKFSVTPTASIGVFEAGRIYAIFDGNNADDQRLTFQSTTGGNVLTDTMSLKNNMVGIGTTTPSAKLEVVGQTILNNGHLSTTSNTAPIGTPGADSGSGATSSMGDATDVAGSAGVVTGTGAVDGELLIVTFDQVYDIPPMCVLTAMDANTAGLSYYVTTTNTDFTIFSINGVTDGTGYSWAYHCIEVV